MAPQRGLCAGFFVIKALTCRSITDIFQNFCYNTKTIRKYTDLEKKTWIYIQFFW